MAMLSMTFQTVGSHFLNTQAVTDEIGKAEAAMLRRSGNLVRVIARRSIKKPPQATKRERQKLKGGGQRKGPTPAGTQATRFQIKYGKHALGVTIKPGTDRGDAGAMLREAEERRGIYRFKARKKIASARNTGAPPFSRTRILPRSLRSVYDRTTRSAVVGAVAFPGSTNAPEILEHGGTAKVRRRKRGRVIKRVQVHRPFIAPALRTAAPKLAPELRNSLSG